MNRASLFRTKRGKMLAGVRISWLLVLLLLPVLATAQPDTTRPAEPAPEFDESQLVTDENATVSENAAANPFLGYCTFKTPLITPQKLISFGYDAQAVFDFPRPAEQTLPYGDENTILPAEQPRQVLNHGLRIGTNWPVISKTSFILNLGVSFLESRYSTVGSVPTQYFAPDPLAQRLRQTGLRSTMLAATVFKPFNHRHFLLVLVGGDINGDYDSFQAFADNLAFTKPWAVAVFGWKRTPNNAIGIGASTTYRAGVRTYVPALLWNKTFNNRWGMELMLPVRGHARYNFSARSILLAGYELEGNSYYIRPLGAEGTALRQLDKLELRKSELRFRMVWEQQVVKFWWLTAQVGWRYNFAFDLVESDAAARDAILAGYNLGNPVYANIGFHLVSP
jgi:hypothetical protein